MFEIRAAMLKFSIISTYNRQKLALLVLNRALKVRSVPAYRYRRELTITSQRVHGVNRLHIDGTGQLNIHSMNGIINKHPYVYLTTKDIVA